MKDFHVVCSRGRFQIAAIIIFSVILTTLFSCDDEEQRHEMLTFFFDGVPPLEREEMIDVNSTDSGGQQMQKDTGPAWIIHKPSRECTNCHDMTKKPRWATPEFTKEPLQLCYDCHPGSNYSGSVDYVHGPVAVGACMRCHNPHRSRHKHLLKLPVPGICQQCHEKEDIESIADHAVESECLNCHVGHSSSAKALLRKDWNMDPNESPGL